MKNDSTYENEVPTLNKVIKVQDDSNPVSIFVMIKKDLTNDSVDLPIRHYVDVEALPRDIAQSVRQAIQGK